MKIICTKMEFAAFVRSCQGKQGYGSCSNCVTSHLCEDNQPEEAIEFVVQEEADEG